MRFDFGFGFGFGFGLVVIASNICTNPGASSHQTVFFVDGGLGKFDFGFGFGFAGRSEQCLYKAQCIIPANRFFFWGGWGRFDMDLVEDPRHGSCTSAL